MSILILGGTGLIGSRLTRQLVGLGHRVVCFDLYPDHSSIAGLDNVDVVVADVTRFEDIIETTTRFDVQRIVNLAYILPPESEQKLQLAMRVNQMGMNNVFEAARLMGIRRVVYASTIAVYGLQSSFGDRPVTEEDHCYPVTVYMAHKLWNEFMAAKYMDRYGMEIPGLRIANVAAPGRTKGISAWQSRCIDELVAGRPFTIPSRRDQRLLIIHVDDTAELFAKLCLQDNLGHAVYNSLAYAITAQEWADAIAAQLPGAVITFDETAPDQPNIYNWSTARLEQDLNAQISPLEEAIRRHIDEARVNLAAAAPGFPTAGTA